MSPFFSETIETPDKAQPRIEYALATELLKEHHGLPNPSRTRITLRQHLPHGYKQSLLRWLLAYSGRNPSLVYDERGRSSSRTR